METSRKTLNFPTNESDGLSYGRKRWDSGKLDAKEARDIIVQETSVKSIILPFIHSGKIRASFKKQIKTHINYFGLKSK